MIRYALRCSEGHAYEAWFADAATFDRLKASGHLSCEICGAGDVTKSLMAPRVGTARPAAPAPEGAPAPAPAPEARSPVTPMERAVAEMRAKVEAHSTYVGRRFADEARAMHEGRKESGPIWGEASPSEARKLREDGIPALPLPFGPREKEN